MKEARGGKKVTEKEKVVRKSTINGRGEKGETE